MWKPRHRGTLAQELGKTTGGVLAALGTLTFCKARFTPQLDMDQRPTVTYSSTYFGGTGDLFAPFPADHVAAIMWIGLALAIGGSLLRCASYWGIASQREEGS